MNISLRDRLLRNQINQMENEYNNISKNLYDSKIQFLKRNHPNNFSSFTYFNKYNYSPYNDIDLQNRITNSLYASKNKNIFTPKYSISQSSSLKNRNIISNNFLSNNFNKPFYKNNNLIEEFKNTLMNTHNLTNKIMLKNNFYKNINNNFNYGLDTNIYTNISDTSINSINISDNSLYSDKYCTSIGNLSDEDINNLGPNINTFNLKYNYNNYNNNNNFNIYNNNVKNSK